jgi:hypothetical protein
MSELGMALSRGTGWASAGEVVVDEWVSGDRFEIRRQFVDDGSAH